MKISGCCVKIAMFGRGSELRYQEEVRGSLFIIAERLIELVYLKYLKASISYNNKQRMEKYPYPQAALREIFYNALIHCNWSANEPIYVKVTDNSLSVSNVCALPLGWSQKTLMNAHKSKPFNPDIANTFFRAGYVEIWGRGFAKVLESCGAAGLAPPAVELLGEDITVTLRRGNSRPVQAAPRPTEHPAPQREFSELESLIVAEIKNNPQTTLTHIAQKAGVTKRSVQTSVNRLAAAGVLCREGAPRRGKWILL